MNNKVASGVKVMEVVEKYRNSPEQGSPEWLQIKYGSDDGRTMGCIGGSEMAYITGDNKYRSLKYFIKQRAGLVSGFVDNIYTRWGTVFEDQIQILVENIMQCEILNTGSIDGVVPFHRYSPDGITTMNFLCKNSESKDTEDILSTVSDDDEIEPEQGSQLFNVLLEYKCPFTRIPAGTIPKEYVPQVKSGLCNLEYADIRVAMFVNASFRKCSYGDWKPDPTYDTEYHRSDNAPARKKIVDREFDKPIAMGGIFVYISLEDLINQPPLKIGHKRERNNILNRGEYGKETLIDFGSCDEYKFNVLMMMLKNKELRSYYPSPKLYSDGLRKIELLRAQKRWDVPDIKFSRSQKIREFKRWCYDKGSVPIGIIPWKLFKCDMLLQHIDPLYLDKYKNKIEDTITIIHSLKSIDDISERQKRYGELVEGKVNVPEVQKVSKLTIDKMAKLDY